MITTASPRRSRLILEPHEINASKVLVRPPQKGLWHLTEPVLSLVPDDSGNFRLLHPGMWPSQRTWWTLKNKVRLLVGGYGAGKTKQLCKRMISLSLHNAPIPVAIVSPTYPMAKKTVIMAITELLDNIKEWFAYWAKRQWGPARRLEYTQNKTPPHEFTIRLHEEGRRSIVGTIIIYSGENPDKLKGSNLAAAGIDEPFIQDVEVFQQMFVRCRHPAARLRELNLTGCVPRDTLVLTRDGWKQIGDMDPGAQPKQFVPLGEAVYGRGGFHEATKFFNNGVDETVKLHAEAGIEIEGTPDHPVMVMGDDGVPVFKRLGARKGKYAHLGQVAIGDWVGVARGMEVWGNKPPKGITLDDAYGLGVWVAEGSLEQKQSRFTITCGDSSVLKFFKEQGVLGEPFANPSGRKDQARLYSKELVAAFKRLGMPLVKSPKRRLPQWVLGAGTRAHAIEFISGMYDGDGHVCANGSSYGIGYTTTSERLAKELRAVLLNVGVVTNLRESVTEPTERVRVRCRRFQLMAFGQNARLLASILKLRIERKRDALEPYKRDMRDSDVVPEQGPLVVAAWNAREKLRWRTKPASVARATATGTDSHEPNKIVERARKGVALSYSTLRDFVAYWRANESKVCDAIDKLHQNIEEGLWWARVTSLEKSSCETADFVIPDTNTFVSGCGITSKQTPEQLNWGYDLAEGDLRHKYDVGVVQMSTLENKALPADYIKRLLDAWDPRVAAAYMHGQFINLQRGLVYYAFDREENVVEVPMPLGAEVGAGMDFNVDPMSATLFWVVKKGPNKHIHYFDEIELPNSDTLEMSQILRRHYGSAGIVTPYCAPEDAVEIHQPLEMIYPDSNVGRSTTSPGGKTDYDCLREAGFELDYSPSGNILRKDRYNAVNALLRPTGGRVRMTISPRCKKLIKNQMLYTHEQMHTPQQKAMGHLLDARDYPVVRLFPADRESLRLVRVQGA